MHRLAPVVCLFALSASAPAQSTMQRLDALDSASAVSGDGLTVVGREWTGGSGYAAAWTLGEGVTALGTFPGGTYSRALAVSADGQVIVGDGDNAAGFIRAFRWEASTGLVDIGIAPLPLHSSARAVNSDGSVVAGVIGSGFRWTASTGIVPIGDLPGHFSSQPQAIDSDGDVIVGASFGGSTASTAFRWTAATGIEALAMPGGVVSESWASDVSDDGQVIVGYYEATPGMADYRGFRWTAATGAVDLGSGAFGFTLINPEATNADCTIIYGYMGNPVAAVSRPFRWTAATGIQYFGPEVGDSSYILDASDDGSVLTGYSAGPGQSVSFRWESGTGSIGRTYGEGAVPNSTGAIGHIEAIGSTSRVRNSLRLVARQLPAHSTGIFIVGPARGSTPLTGGQGTLLIGGPIGRFSAPGQVLNSGPSGSFELDVDLDRIPTPMAHVSFQQGELWNFQAWFRDTNPNSTSNFTDGVSVRMR